jgi:hypothetical protein
MNSYVQSNRYVHAFLLAALSYRYLVSCKSKLMPKLYNKLLLLRWQSVMYQCAQRLKTILAAQSFYKKYKTAGLALNQMEILCVTQYLSGS